jgi:hypothetical protein
VPFVFIQKEEVISKTPNATIRKARRRMSLFAWISIDNRFTILDFKLRSVLLSEVAPLQTALPPRPVTYSLVA